MRCCRLGVLSAALLLVLGLHSACADMPPSSNPYAGKSYGGCRGGYCESPDEALELQFWQAAGSGDAKTVKQLLEGGKLNLTRNIVPDDDGLARVVDVAVWVASEKGHHDVMRVRVLGRTGCPNRSFQWHADSNSNCGCAASSSNSNISGLSLTQHALWTV